MIRGSIPGRGPSGLLLAGCREILPPPLKWGDIELSTDLHLVPRLRMMGALYVLYIGLGVDKGSLTTLYTSNSQTALFHNGNYQQKSDRFIGLKHM